MILIILALAGALAAGYTDLKSGIIPNKLTMSLFTIGIFGNILLNGFTILKDLFLSVGMIFIIGYGFWSIGGWSAGDAKEFLFLSALLPRYPESLIEVFNPHLGAYPFVLSIFINTFLAIFPFLLIYGVYVSYKKSGLHDFGRPLENPLELLGNALAYTAAFIATILLNVSTIFALPIIIISYPIEKRIKAVLSIIVTAYFLMINPLYTQVLGYFLSVLVAIILFKLAWNSIKTVREQALKETLPINDLSEGTVLSKTFRSGELTIEPMARGLHKEELEGLKKEASKTGLKEIEVKRAMPFAPIIFIGLLIGLTIGDLMVVMRGG